MARPKCERSPVLSEILALNKSGKGCKSIASELNRRGIPSKTGGLWGHSSVQNILNRNAAYLREERNRSKTFRLR